MYLTLHANREGRSVSFSLSVPPQVLTKLRTNLSEREFAQKSKTRGFIAKREGWFINQSPQSPADLINMFAFYFEGNRSRTVTFDSEEQAKQFTNLTLNFFKEQIAPFVQELISSSKESGEASVAIAKGTVIPEFRLSNPPTPEISTKGPVFITDANGDTYVATLKKTRRKNAYSEIHANLKAKNEEQIKQIQATTQQQLEIIKEAYASSVNEYKRQIENLQYELREAKSVSQEAPLSAPLATYIRHQVCIVPYGEKRIAYLVPFDYRPKKIKRMSMREIPEDIAKTMRRKVYMLLCRTYNTKPTIYLGTISQNEGWQKFHHYHSYNDGAVCTGSYTPPDPKTFSDLIKIRDEIETLLEVINQESIVYRQPPNLPTDNSLWEQSRPIQENGWNTQQNEETEDEELEPATT